MDAEHPGLAETLVARRPDRFSELHRRAAAHISQHKCGAAALPAVEARELAVLARATHSSYVLELGAGLGQSTLYIADAFGHTGRIDAIEPDDIHATFVEDMARLFALDTAIRVHRAAPVSVVPGLSGPYDLVVLHGVAPESLAEDLVRLVRTGGSMLFLPAAGETTLAQVPGQGGLLERIAGDPRLLAWFARDFTRGIATRVR